MPTMLHAAPSRAARLAHALAPPANAATHTAPAHLADHVLQLLVGGGGGLVHIVALPEEGHAVAVALLHVAVHAVVAHVGLRAVEPGQADAALVQVEVVPGAEGVRKCGRVRRRQNGGAAVAAGGSGGGQAGAAAAALTCGSRRRTSTSCSSGTGRQTRPRSPAERQERR